MINPIKLKKHISEYLETISKQQFWIKSFNFNKFNLPFYTNKNKQEFVRFDVDCFAKLSYIQKYYFLLFDGLKLDEKNKLPQKLLSYLYDDSTTRLINICKNNKLSNLVNTTYKNIHKFSKNQDSIDYEIILTAVGSCNQGLLYLLYERYKCILLYEKCNYRYSEIFGNNPDKELKLKLSFLKNESVEIILMHKLQLEMIFFINYKLNYIHKNKNDINYLLKKFHLKVNSNFKIGSYEKIFLEYMINDKNYLSLNKDFISNTSLNKSYFIESDSIILNKNKHNPSNYLSNTNQNLLIHKNNRNFNFDKYNLLLNSKDKINLNKSLKFRPQKLQVLNSSTTENSIANSLKRLGYEFKREFRFDQFHVDFYIEKINTVVEYMGIYSHFYPFQSQINQFDKVRRDYIIYKYGVNYVQFSSFLVHYLMNNNIEHEIIAKEYINFNEDSSYLLEKFI